MLLLAIMFVPSRGKRDSVRSGFLLCGGRVYKKYTAAILLLLLVIASIVSFSSSDAAYHDAAFAACFILFPPFPERRTRPARRNRSPPFLFLLLQPRLSTRGSKVFCLPWVGQIALEITIMMMTTDHAPAHGRPRGEESNESTSTTPEEWFVTDGRAGRYDRFSPSS
mmetsp:Transcript_28054/g.78682  ORF Transcript_28054/g.78682 Transcript_28054/m.78682 type:complete len:167 (-) Transcript_28054:584-1084(-)